MPSIVTLFILTGVRGRSPCAVGVVSIFFTTSMPDVILPNTGCFDGPGEIMLLVSGLLSAASSAGMIERLRRLANEFTEMKDHDAQQPLGERRPSTLIVAMRPWEVEELHALRRPKRK